MDIYCKNCQKTVGKIAEEKIPAGRQASVICPLCKEKILVKRPSSPEPADQNRDAVLATSTAPDHAPNLHFSITAVFREAWQKTRGFKGPVWASLLLVMAAMLGIGLVTAFLQRIMGNTPSSIALGMAIQITANIAMAPVTAGYLMIALKHIQGRPVNYRMTFAYFSSFFPLIGAALLMTLMITIGLFLLIIPGIYLIFSYLLVLPLIVEKRMGPWQAMEASRKAIHRCWFKVFGLELILGITLIGSGLLFGIGLIWTLPMCTLATGILYREIFGIANGRESIAV
ncbi:MAG: hypothetical protein WCT30_03040 [Desulfurivibrionaceae bacterium]|jgi:hypothetical protein